MRFYELFIGPADFLEQRTGPAVYGSLILVGVFLLAVLINLALFMGFPKKWLFLILAALFTACFWSMVENVLMNQFQMSVAFRHNFYLGRLLDYAVFLLLTTAVLIEIQPHCRMRPSGPS